MELQDWTKILSKKGHEIYIGDLEAYVDAQLKDGNFTEQRNDILMECPYCIDAYKHDRTYEGPYKKHKLYVTKNKQMGHCFRCDKIFINSNENIRYELSVPGIYTAPQEFQVEKLNGRPWNLELFNDFDEESDKGMEYLLKKRHGYFRELKSLLHIRFSNNNPVIPFYYHGELIYYQIKMAFGNSKLPYFSPPISHKPLYIIEKKENTKFVICEGTFDAIACLILFPDRTPVAILGSSITDYQIAMLRTYVPEDILIYMDETSLSIKNRDKIQRYINYADFDIQFSNGEDPEERLKRLLREKSEDL